MAGLVGIAALTLSSAPAAFAAPDVSAVPNVKINEIETDGAPDWVELINREATAIDLSGFVLTGRANAVTFTVPAGTIVPSGGLYVVENSAFKLKKNDRIGLYGADAVTELDAFEWGDHHLSTWGRGTVGSDEILPLAQPTKGALNPGQSAVNPDPGGEPGDGPGEPGDGPWQSIAINEVTSANTDPYRDAIELFNRGDVDVDVAGWTQADSGSQPAALNAPNGTIVPAGGFLVLLSNVGLSSDGDAVKLYLSDRTTMVDQVSWTTLGAQPGSLSACGDGSGNWIHTELTSWGVSNAAACDGPIIAPVEPAAPCETQAPSDLAAELANGVAWPGGTEWRVADRQCQFVSELSGQDVSGLDIDPNDPDVLWAVKNKSHLYRLVKSGDLWVPDQNNDWAQGKRIVFPNGEGQPDSEGITVGPDGALYLTTERDNLKKDVALDSVLRYDPLQEGTTLTPTAQWDVTADFADIISTSVKADANLGFEGITWVPDEFLVDGGFVDATTGEAYDPKRYPGHGEGLYFLALEKNGHLYAYALNADGSFVRIQTISSGMPLIAETQWDPDAERLWAVGDDSVGGSSTLLSLEDGVFTVDQRFNRPAGLANLNLEGFAIAGNASCVDGMKEVVRSDDGNNGGHTLWSGLVRCDVGAAGEESGENPGEEGPTETVLTVTPSVVSAGGAVSITVTGLRPGVDFAVELHSEPVLLGTAVSDAHGGLVLGSVEIPADTPAGAHSIVVAAIEDPNTVVARMGVTVIAAVTPGEPGPKPEPGIEVGGSQSPGVQPGTPAGVGTTSSSLLAETGGSSFLGLLGASAAMLLLGGGITVLRRRQRQVMKME